MAKKKATTKKRKPAGRRVSNREIAKMKRQIEACLSSAARLRLELEDIYVWLATQAGK